MDTNKKIIVAVVSAVFLLVLIGAMKYILFPSTGKADTNIGGFAISIPKVDEEKIDDASKKRKYDKEKGVVAADWLSPDTGDTIIQPVKKKTVNPFTRSRKNKKKKAYNTNRKASYDADREQQQLEEELKTLLAIQEQAGVAPIQTLDPSQISALAQRTSGQLTNKIKPQNRFYGAGNNSDNKILDLIPAETVDQGVLVNRSTIGIRTKKSIRLNDPPITIPKDAIVYGKVIFDNTDRLRIDIQSYKTNNKLYLLRLRVFDFDGREGVHLGNRTWTKIPSKVAKDVYDYTYTKGTQASAFGGNNTIDLDEAKDVALLSGTKEIAAELFDKRRVFMPRKYHLWINVDTTNR